ncbi:unnamed protein product [Brassicogethes aeneus]|uniref:Nucleoporin Nup37 n=1 Tax=Brassicogethes aeneus TaxID=1431903 RepID=A0A9P0FMF4_BRAAE|nr:unnamed protein product [Brassicogethes aeneus]
MDVLSSMRKNFSEPNYTEDFSEHGQILSVHFSQFEWSQDLILIAFENKIVLAFLNLEDVPSLNVMSEFKHQCRCSTLSISPETNLNIVPNILMFCVGGSDFKLRIYTSDMNESNTCKILAGHTSYINDVSFDPENTYLASVSDDNTAKIWSVDDFKLKNTFNLTSPGMSAVWHRDDCNKLLVGEKIGIIRFYNVESEMPVISLDYGKPLIGAHWAPVNEQMVSSLHLGELLVWDLSKPCFPVWTSVLFPENGGSIKFSPQAELLAATNSLEGTLKVVHVKSQATKLAANLTLPTNVSWHYRYPLVCVGDDRKLCFWKVSAN